MILAPSSVVSARMSSEVSVAMSGVSVAVGLGVGVAVNAGVGVLLGSVSIFPSVVSPLHPDKKKSSDTTAEKNRYFVAFKISIASLIGIEPTTTCFGGRHSIR